MNVNPIRNCPHIQDINFCPINEFSKLPINRLKCENCDENYELWICITCGKSFFSRYINNHFYNHYITNNKENHNICISFLDFSIWCYKCKTEGFSDIGSYIYEEIFEKYIDILSQYKFSSNFHEKRNDVFNYLDLIKLKLQILNIIIL